MSYAWDLSGKLECKRALQREMGLEVRDDVPLLGFIGRLDWQKGPDLIQESISEMMNEDVQVIMLGSGLPELEQFMQWAEGTYSDKFRGWVGFNVAMSHRITAGKGLTRPRVTRHTSHVHVHSSTLQPTSVR